MKHFLTKAVVSVRDKHLASCSYRWSGSHNRFDDNVLNSSHEAIHVLALYIDDQFTCHR